MIFFQSIRETTPLCLTFISSVQLLGSRSTLVSPTNFDDSIELIKLAKPKISDKVSGTIAKIGVDSYGQIIYDIKINLLRIIMLKIKKLIFSGWQYIVYEPNGKDLNWWRIIVSIGVVILAIYFLYQNIEDDRLRIEREKSPRFTVGIITEHYTHGKIVSTTSIYYKYSVVGTEYFGKAVVPFFYDNPNKGDRYFIKYASNNPENSEFLFDNPVPIYPVNIPDTGWNKIPNPFSN